MQNLSRPALAIILFAVSCIICLHLFSLNAGEQPFASSLIHHEIHVVISPEERRFSADDTLTVPDHFPRELRFTMHRGLNPVARSKGVSIRRDDALLPYEGLESYRVGLPHDVKSFVISYGGIIDHPLEQVGKEQARGYSHTMGKISHEGVFLSGLSHWYPVLDTELISFTLTIELPREWDAVSQGERTLHLKDPDKTLVRWSSPEPQEEIYLIAGKFHEYGKDIVRSPVPRAGGEGVSIRDTIQAMVFLRSPDEALAAKYLEATARYIPMYEHLIGPYPYKKFALVENFWETGFGMPSFTLLGPKVIRFPFILNTSYPHEILHTWWGNSVFPDYSAGNWSEGLTAYLSDHLNAEQQAEGRDYRQATLQKYADYVSAGKDFPLTEFRSRHSSSTEAIGYGKSLMFFHMLRLELGDEVFIRGLRDFYRENKFRGASFGDLQRSFEKVSGKKLESMFTQWVTRTGAPELLVRNAESHHQGGSHEVTVSLEQVQRGAPYRLLVPIAITMEGKEQAFQTHLLMDNQRQVFTLVLESRPLRIDIDPEFDIFRRLNHAEIPPAISQVLGSKQLRVVLPSSSAPSLLQAYRTFAEALGKTGPDQVEVKLDREILSLPSDRAVCVIGRENLWIQRVISPLSQYGLRMDQTHVHIAGSVIPFADHAIVLTGRNPENQDSGLLFVSSDMPEALRGLSRKLPHYHKYSYLVFRGVDPENIAKGRWPVSDSPLTVYLPDKGGTSSKVDMGGLQVRKPLNPAAQNLSAERMMKTVSFLSGDDLKGRALGSRELDRAAEYIRQQFREAGLIPAGDAGENYFQTWEVDDQAGQRTVLKNIVGVIPGRKPEWASQSIVVGAHFDHLGSSVAPDGKEEIYHGADDNASGVAVLLELARVMGGKPSPGRSVVFVAFTGEEDGRKGSRYYLADQQRYGKHHILGMVNIDTVGRLRNNKLLILGAGSAREWEHIVRGAGHVSGIEVDLVSEELDSSDQKSFQEAGIPAVQFFSGAHVDYHRPTDTADKIDAEGLVKVASVAKGVIEYLANRQNPLTASITPETTESEPKKERKVSFGIIPDFAYQGQGCRVAGVIQGSQAEKAGLREGDIVIGINEQRIGTLRDFSDFLKTVNPGDSLSITFLRDGKQMAAEGTVVQRQ